MADTLKLTPHETVTIRSASPELLDVEGRWGPGGKPPPAHYHPEQDEHFEVQTRPALRTENWFRSIDRLFREGRVGKNGMPGPLAFGVFLSEYRDVFRLGSPPDLIARPLLVVLGLFGRARGYRPWSGSPC